MTFTFKPGKHRARPLYWLRWWPLLINPKKIRRKVIFWFDGSYTLPDGDQEDHNKLFGLSFGRIHRNSARFGWRYDPARQRFILSAYCYVNGERIMEDLCDCVANHGYTCSLYLDGPEYLFTVWNDRDTMVGATSIMKGHTRRWARLLGPFFGGNRPAPKKITIQLSKL